MRKASVHWVPRLLTVDQKHTRRTLSRTNLNLFEEDPANFLKRFVTMDETWVHHFTPEAKQQSKQWKHPGLGFLGCRWYSAYRLSPKRTNDQWCILCFTSDAITGKNKIKRCGKLTKGVLFHHSNAPVHKSVIAMAAIHDCGFKLI